MIEQNRASAILILLGVVGAAPSPCGGRRRRIPRSVRRGANAFGGVSECTGASLSLWRLARARDSRPGPGFSQSIATASSDVRCWRRGIVTPIASTRVLSSSTRWAVSSMEARALLLRAKPGLGPGAPDGNGPPGPGGRLGELGPVDPLASCPDSGHRTVRIGLRTSVPARRQNDEHDDPNRNNERDQYGQPVCRQPSVLALIAHERRD